MHLKVALTKKVEEGRVHFIRAYFNQPNQLYINLKFLMFFLSLGLKKGVQLRKFKFKVGWSITKWLCGYWYWQGDEVFISSNYVIKGKSDFFRGSIAWRPFDMVKNLTFSMVAKCRVKSNFLHLPENGIACVNLYPRGEITR